jgi:hypothetical protein
MPYTSSQLVTLACQITKQPGFLTQCGQFLNMILADYCQTVEDLDSIRQTTTINVGAAGAAYPLPANHLRTREVFYLVNGQPFYLNQIPLEDYDQLFVGPGVDNYPQSYCVQVETSPHTLLFWPPPAIPLSVTVRYQPQMADINSPETSAIIPWFPNQRLLLRDLCVDMLMMGDDTQRKQDLQKDVEIMMRKYLIMDDDKEGYARTVKLDRRMFRPRDNYPPTKLSPLG